jgi:hypothetical protein
VAREKEVEIPAEVQVVSRTQSETHWTTTLENSSRAVGVHMAPCERKVGRVLQELLA